MGGGSLIRIAGGGQGRDSLIPSAIGTVLLLGVLAVAPLSSAPAGATQRSTMPAPRVVAQGAIRSLLQPATKTIDTDFGAGYLTELAKITAVSATFTVPTVECGGFDSDVAPGADMVNKSGDQVGAFVDVGCQNGTEEDFIEVYLNKKFKSWSEASLDGNTFHVSVTETKTVASVTVSDLTRNITKGATAPGAAMTEADFDDNIGLNPTTGKPMPVPVFKANKFTVADANGTPVAKLPNERFDLEQNSRIYVVAGFFNSADSFVDSWQNG